MKISQNFVAFSEYTNFTFQNLTTVLDLEIKDQKREIFFIIIKEIQKTIHEKNAL